MRNISFVAVHRGGHLSKEQHRQLIKWAVVCAENVLPLFGDIIDERLHDALRVANTWECGGASVGDARNSSVKAHEVARESAEPAANAVARAVGHAVATAHMADHLLGPAWYGLKAVKSAGGSIAEERKWQDSKLPPGTKDLVLTARKKRKV